MSNNKKIWALEFSANLKEYVCIFRLKLFYFDIEKYNEYLIGRSHFVRKNYEHILTKNGIVINV